MTCAAENEKLREFVAKVAQVTDSIGREAAEVLREIGPSLACVCAHPNRG